MLAIVFKYHCAFLAPVVLFAPFMGRAHLVEAPSIDEHGAFCALQRWLLLLTPLLDAYFTTQTFTNVTTGNTACQIHELPEALG